MSAQTISQETARAFLALLAGRVADDLRWPPAPEAASLAEHAVNDDVRARALAQAHRATLPDRLARARAADDVVVLLPDGSSLSLSAALRLLAQKEERRAYPPLRLPLERARQTHARPVEERLAFLRALPGMPAAVDDDALRSLQAFLQGTVDVAMACRELLAGIGGAALEGEAALRRGLDLPDPLAFSADVVVAAVRLALSSTPPPRAVARTTAPRALGGLCVDDGDTVRLLVAPCLSAGPFLALSTGAGALVARALDAAPHAPALGLALVDEAARRAAGEERARAQRAFRVLVATALLHARAHAAVAVAAAHSSDDVDELRERARAAVREALLGDPGGAFADALLAPPWPDGVCLLPLRVAAVVDAQRRARAARGWLSLREALDEGCVARPRALLALRELPAPEVDADRDLRGWRALVGELC